MVTSGKYLKKLQSFVKKFVIDKEALGSPIDKQLRSEIPYLYNSLLHLDIKYSDLCSEPSHIYIILNCVSEVLINFQKIDIIKPLGNIDYILFMAFCKHVIKFKNIFHSESVIEKCKEGDLEFVFHYNIEQYLCDTYKSKLIQFKADLSEQEVEKINEEFSNFLVEYIHVLARLQNNELQFKNIELLMEIADHKVLIENIHIISHVIFATNNMALWKSITTFSIENSLMLENSVFFHYNRANFKLEAKIITYYTLQYICEHFKFDKTLQLLSIFTIEDFISFIKSVTHSAQFDKLYEKSTEFINLKIHKEVKTVSSEEIMKCLNILQLLLKSFNDCKFINCSLTIVIFSLLNELVMITDIDKNIVMVLINLAIEYLKICNLPSNFPVVSFALNIYQQLKFDDDLKINSINLCKSLSCDHLTEYQMNKYVIHDLKRIINVEENWVDKSFVMTFFLNKTYGPEIEMNDKALNDIFCTLNEQIVYISHEHNKAVNSLLLSPYGLLLDFSLSNKNENNLFNNLALLDDYITIFFDHSNDLRLADRTYFILIVLQHYNDIVECLPDDFLFKCYKYVLHPISMEISIYKSLLKLMSPIDLKKFIDMLTIETLTVIKGFERSMNETYTSYLHLIWSNLLKMKLNYVNKNVRKDMVNYFCFIINKTFLFRPKVIKTEQGLTFLLKLMSSLLKLSWVNTTLLINCSLRILTFVEKSNVSGIDVLAEAIELLIVLYKCPNNVIKTVLSLYIASFSQLFKKCWSFIKSHIKNNMLVFDSVPYILFHKFQKCSNLFQRNLGDFDIICRYFIENMIEYLAFNEHLPDMFMQQCHKIIFNIFNVYSIDEMKNLMTNISGPVRLMLDNLYKEYMLLCARN